MVGSSGGENAHLNLERSILTPFEELDRRMIARIRGSASSDGTSWNVSKSSVPEPRADASEVQRRQAHDRRRTGPEHGTKQHSTGAEDIPASIPGVDNAIHGGMESTRLRLRHMKNAADDHAGKFTSLSPPSIDAGEVVGTGDDVNTGSLTKTENTTVAGSESGPLPATVLTPPSTFQARDSFADVARSGKC